MNRPRRRFVSLLTSTLVGVPLVAVPLLGVGAGTAAPATAHVAATRPVVDQHALTRRIKTYLAGRKGSASVAFLDLTTGQSYTYRLGTKFPTASVVKVEVLAALLLKHQRAGTAMTAKEKKLASRMIRRSDNAATNVLWARIGGWKGLARSNKALGMISTQAPRVAGKWGGTRTTAKDQVRLLSNLSSPDSVLERPARDYIWTLMRKVTKAQRWGVPAAADRPSTAALKNGWSPQRADHGRWAINSVGRVRIEGRYVAIAILTRGNPSMSYGTRTATQLARLVGTAVRTAA